MVIGGAAGDDPFQGVGFVVTGNGNWLSDNTARANFEHGFTIDGHSNRLDHNLAYYNGDNGFNVEKGVGNTFDTNVAGGNTDEGFLVGEAGGGNTFIYNTSFDSRRSDGYRLEGDDNCLSFNLANGNYRDGIHAETDDFTDPESTAERNLISSNTKVSATATSTCMTTSTAAGLTHGVPTPSTRAKTDRRLTHLAASASDWRPPAPAVFPLVALMA